MNSTCINDPTRLDALAFAILAARHRSTDHRIRKAAITLSNRWGGSAHYCTTPVGRHLGGAR